MTWKFLVDEDMPRSTAKVLRESGYQVEDVRDVGLRGHTDQDVFDHAQAHGEVIVTADKGFGDIFRFRPGSHAGMIAVRISDELPIARMHEELLKGLANLTSEGLQGALVIVEVDRVRIRRAS